LSKCVHLAGLWLPSRCALAFDASDAGSYNFE
jgi:hypothetical protein